MYGMTRPNGTRARGVAWDVQSNSSLKYISVNTSHAAWAEGL